MADDPQKPPEGTKGQSTSPLGAVDKPVSQPATPSVPQAAASAAAKPAAAAPVGPPDPAPAAGTAQPAFIDALRAALPGAVVHVSYWVGDWTMVVPVARLLETGQRLRDAPESAFDTLSDVTAIDWPMRPERFDVVYCLYSTRHRHRIRLKVKASEHEAVPSVTGLWPAANWLEREVYDMFGVNLAGHPDRRRILMPEDWQGFPQRKDYPLEGPGELLMENPLEWLELRRAKEEADIE